MTAVWLNKDNLDEQWPLVGSLAQLIGFQILSKGKITYLIILSGCFITYKNDLDRTIGSTLVTTENTGLCCATELFSTDLQKSYLDFLG